MMRGAIFSALASLGADDTRVLDLYAGTGALGIEALSRGSGTCDFVEKDRAMAAVIKENLALTGLADRARVHVAQVRRSAGTLMGHFTLVLADPPYHESGSWDDLGHIVSSGLVDFKRGIIAIEHSAKNDPPASVGGFRLVKELHHGDSAVAIYGPPNDN
jgi:16S rRNA (guanine966-N2)-methyltransferase